MLLWSVVELLLKMVNGLEYNLPSYSYLFLMIEELYPTIANIRTRIYEKNNTKLASRRWYGIVEFVVERTLSFALPLLGYLYCDKMKPSLVVFSCYFAFNSVYFLLAIFGFRYVVRF